MQNLTDQLVDELDRALVHPVRSLLGLDLGDMLAARLPERVAELSAALTSGPAGDAEAQVAARELLAALWPADVTDAAWWRSTVGLLCARALATVDGAAVTHQVAADMLGVTRGTVAQMIRRGSDFSDEGDSPTRRAARGFLTRDRDGRSIERASVLQRLVHEHESELRWIRLGVLPTNDVGDWTWTAWHSTLPGVFPAETGPTGMLLHTQDRDEAMRVANESMGEHGYVVLGWLPDAG